MFFEVANEKIRSLAKANQDHCINLNLTLNLLDAEDSIHLNKEGATIVIHLSIINLQNSSLAKYAMYMYCQKIKNKRNTALTTVMY
jgi:ABC-type uncharacterized transport system auxiliary subunit